MMLKQYHSTMESYIHNSGYPHAIMDSDGYVLALVAHPFIARRIAELLNKNEKETPHGEQHPERKSV